MNICRLAIVRPVATIVLMLVLLVFGTISFKRLAVREFPDIELPIVTVRTTYPGASAAVIESKITPIIENTVSGIDGLVSISSMTRDGLSVVTMEFGVERDPDMAANDVRDRVSRILSRLPDESDAPVIYKYDSEAVQSMVIGVTSTEMDRMQLTDYLDRYIVDRFSVVDGVANVVISGAKEQAMRIWLNPSAMAARNITVEDVEAALNAENVEYPAGRIESAEREFIVRVSRQYFTPEDFRRLVISRRANGDLIRMQDIAEVRLEPKLMRSHFEINGEPMVGLSIYKQSKGNVLIISAAVRQLLEDIRPTLPPGMTISIRRDEANFIRASIDEVRESLMIAAGLVILIVFLFLGTIRAALIPAMTVPISLVASCTVLYMCGYSINMLTLLALVLAIGMVVDDAIVVLENVQRRIREGEPPLFAAVHGSKQVLLAVIATTAVLVAVFLPISLWEGKTGKMFSEFAVAMTAAVTFSSLVAVTLTPLMCARLLASADRVSFFGGLVNRVMVWCEKGYRSALHAVLGLRLLILLVFVGFCLFVVWAWKAIPAEYEPVEDRGFFSVSFRAPEGTGFYEMHRIADSAIPLMYSAILPNEFLYYTMALPNWDTGTDGAANTVQFTLDFTPWNQRSRNTVEILQSMRPKLAQLTTADPSPRLPSGIGAGGAPVQFVIGGPDYSDLVVWRDKIWEKLKDYPGFVDKNYDYKETTPQFLVQINRERAAELGVSASSIGAALEIMLGSKRVTTFLDRGQEYDVMLQAALENRRSPTDLSNIHIRSKTTTNPIPLDNLASIKEVGDAAQLSRYNRVRAITFFGNVAPGYSLNQVLDHLEHLVRTELPKETQIFYKGQSKDLRESTGSMYLVMGVSILLAYLVLAAQFESFISPLVVMFTVPLGMVGALAGLMFMGLTMNIFSQIGIIMLVGLAAKNGILIVEFANQLRDEGHEFYEALLSASTMRLRPILMTGISTVFGAIPLLLASGAGAASRRCLGAVVVYGGLSSCLLTLFVVPAAYLVFARHQKPPHAREKELLALEARTAGGAK